MTTFTIDLSAAELKALEYVSTSANDWIQNVVHDRCRIAIEEIVVNEVNRLLDAGLPVPSSKDEIVLQADIKSAAQRQQELIDSLDNQ